MILCDWSSKDKISDATVNLIKGYLCEYTEICRNNISENFCISVSLDKSEFNYVIESFVSKNYYLQYIVNEKGEEKYVLLTSLEILM